MKVMKSFFYLKETIKSHIGIALGNYLCAIALCTYFQQRLMKHPHTRTMTSCWNNTNSREDMEFYRIPKGIFDHPFSCGHMYQSTQHHPPSLSHTATIS
jgi:hypothetical protein